MKKIINIMIGLVLIAALTGCGTKQKLENKITEKILETATGGDIDIDEGEVTVKGEDGKSVTFGSTEWPSSETAKKLPEFKKGKISSVMSTENYVMVAVEEVEEKDFIDYYRDALKIFVMAGNVSVSEDALTYGGSDENGVMLTLHYVREGKTLTLTGAQYASPEEAGAVPENRPSDKDISFMSNISPDNIKWSAPEFAAEIPELKDGKINQMNFSKNFFTINAVDIEKDSYEKYFGNVKEIFKNDSFEINNPDTATFYGSNDGGLSITLSYTIADKSLMMSATQN